MLQWEGKHAKTQLDPLGKALLDIKEREKNIGCKGPLKKEFLQKGPDPITKERSNSIINSGNGE